MWGAGWSRGLQLGWLISFLFFWEVCLDFYIWSSQESKRKRALMHKDFLILCLHHICWCLNSQKNSHGQTKVSMERMGQHKSMGTDRQDLLGNIHLTTYRGSKCFIHHYLYYQYHEHLMFWFKQMMVLWLSLWFLEFNALISRFYNSRSRRLGTAQEDYEDDAKEVKQTKVTSRSKHEPTCLSIPTLSPNFLPGVEQWHEH